MSQQTCLVHSILFVITILADEVESCRMADFDGGKPSVRINSLDNLITLVLCLMKHKQLEFGVMWAHNKMLQFSM